MSRPPSLNDNLRKVPQHNTNIEKHGLVARAAGCFWFQGALPFTCLCCTIAGGAPLLLPRLSSGLQVWPPFNATEQSGVWLIVGVSALTSALARILVHSHDVVPFLQDQAASFLLSAGVIFALSLLDLIFYQAGFTASPLGRLLRTPTSQAPVAAAFSLGRVAQPGCVLLRWRRHRYPSRPWRCFRRIRDYQPKFPKP